MYLKKCNQTNAILVQQEKLIKSSTKHGAMSSCRTPTHVLDKGCMREFPGNGVYN